jgi:hypothetical protein
MIDDNLNNLQPENAAEKIEAIAKLNKLFDKGKMDHLSVDLYDELNETHDIFQEEAVGLDEERLNSLDISDAKNLVSKIESELKQRELSIEKFKKVFKENNKDNIIQRHVKLFIISTDDTSSGNPYADIIFQYKYMISDGDLTFLEEIDTVQARIIVEELELLIKEIDIEKVEKEEKKIKKENEKYQHKNEKQKKVYLISRLLRIGVFYETNLFKKILELLNLSTSGFDGKLSEYHKKKFKNKLQNFKLEDLQRIRKKYNELQQIAKEHGGDLEDPDDLELVLAELE